MPSETARAVERADLDELLRLVDALCDRREWDALVDLRDRCRGAHRETGRQLWPAATNAEYRLALEAPGPWAASVLVEGAGRFALGPLPEVAASTHEWDELGPHVPPGPAGALAAHECVVRGEDLRGAEIAGPPVLDLPLALEPWEPGYCLATYRAHDADFPSPSLPRLADTSLPPASPASTDRGALDALLEIVRAWTTASDADATAVAVEGDELAAIAALGRDRARTAPLDLSGALALLAWAGASGGAHGRRPGGAAGRFAAWWAAASLTGLADEWPVDGARLGDAAARLRWRIFDTGDAATGWVLRVAVADPGAGRAWAVDAVDRAESAGPRPRSQ